mmetsp:Transcript_42291/g.128056  ORF Transcript_42291/g.128056 Transcript_42291/m.128056 type:complete len:231 (+) Transcript_42291:793-1485(+)
MRSGRDARPLRVLEAPWLGDPGAGGAVHWPGGEASRLAGLAGAALRPGEADRPGRHRAPRPGEQAGLGHVWPVGLRQELPRLLCGKAQLRNASGLQGVPGALPRPRSLGPPAPGDAAPNRGRSQRGAPRRPAGRHGALRGGPPRRPEGRAFQLRACAAAHGPHAPDPRAPGRRGPPAAGRPSLRRPGRALAPEALPALVPRGPGHQARATGRPQPLGPGPEGSAGRAAGV